MTIIKFLLNKLSESLICSVTVIKLYFCKQVCRRQFTLQIDTRNVAENCIRAGCEFFEIKNIILIKFFSVSHTENNSTVDYAQMSKVLGYYGHKELENRRINA